MEYLIRFRQMHETFRQPEIEALAELNKFTVEWLSYSDDVGCKSCQVLKAKGNTEAHYTISPIYVAPDEMSPCGWVSFLQLPFASSSSSSSTVLTVVPVALRHRSLF